VYFVVGVFYCAFSLRRLDQIIFCRPIVRAYAVNGLTPINTKYSRLLGKRSLKSAMIGQCFHNAKLGAVALRISAGHTNLCQWGVAQRSACL
jgi:hypothetical protein